MKLVVSLLLISIIAGVVYSFVSKRERRGKRSRKLYWKPVGMTAIVFITLLVCVGFLMHKEVSAPDMQCATVHARTSVPPIRLISAMDYFLQGNYDYDGGNCAKAIMDYTRSLQLAPTYPEAYNNRAYTYMRMKKYPEALTDLDTAITLNSTYTQALMNRGDIHNYYYAIDRQSAVRDYEKVITLGYTQNTSVCGHRFLAIHNGWNLGTLLALPMEIVSPCR